MQQVASTLNLYAMSFNKLAQFVSPVPDLLAWAVNALSLSWGGSGPICFPTKSHLGQNGGDVTGLPMQENHSDCCRVAQHALVLGSSGHVKPDPIVPAQPAQCTHSGIQSASTQESVKPRSTCLAPRASEIKEQGFSEAVARRIEAPQRGSTRSVYEAKWRLSNQVDFRAPPVKSIADFLLYQFQERKLLPKTIDGYRSAIADKLRNSPINISKDENLTHLLDSFHRDRPKGWRGISWNLSLVLHQLTKAPFEPIKEASLKHLIFKTGFLLALGSGKRRNEIHAWQDKNHQTPVRLVKSVSIPITQLSFQNAGQRVQTVWPQWLFQPWPKLRISPSSLIGSYFWTEHCVTTWTGPQTSGRTRIWILSSSRKASTKTSPLPPSPHGLSRL